jgi:hypothetical protein
MKIGRQFPQFSNGAALLIITGKQQAEFYRASSGDIVRFGGFELDASHFSDKEGFFGNRHGGGKGGVSGSVREEPKIENVKEFLRVLGSELEKELKHQRYSEVYVYAPQYLMRQVKVVVKKCAGKSYAMSFTGNYLKSHPTVLLGMLENRVERKAAELKIVPTKREAGKILKRPKNG